MNTVFTIGYTSYKIERFIEILKKNNISCLIDVKNLKIDIQDLMQKNIRKIKKSMNLEEIEKTLSQNIYEYIQNTTESLKSSNITITQDQIDEINDETYFNIKTLSIKSKKAMTILDKDGFGISEMFFPNCMYSYLIKDPQLELIGICDKIEIIDGKYYPISIKSTNPPIKGLYGFKRPKLYICFNSSSKEIFISFIFSSIIIFLSYKKTHKSKDEYNPRYHLSL